MVESNGGRVGVWASGDVGVLMVLVFVGVGLQGVTGEGGK